MATGASRARAAMNMTPPTAEPAGPKSQQLVTVENRIARTRLMEGAFADAMPRGMEAKMILRDAMTALRTTPKLAETTEESFFGALMTAAQLGLRPNVGSIGHGWVLPYKNRRKNVTEAQWILGYQGMVELAWRSQLVSGITAHTIFEGEEYAVRYGTDDVLEHTPILAPVKGRVPIAHYAVVRMSNGGRVWHIMSDEETMEIAARSAAFRDGHGPWIDDPLPMKRKSALRALWRFTPKSEAMAIAIDTDEKTRLVTSTGTELDDDAPDVGASGEGERETINVTRAAAPDAGAETVPADVVTERTAQKLTTERRALLRQIETKHGPAAPDVILAYLDGEQLPITHLTDAELSGIRDFDWERYVEERLAAAAEADGK